MLSGSAPRLSPRFDRKLGTGKVAPLSSQHAGNNAVRTPFCLSSRRAGHVEVDGDVAMAHENEQATRMDVDVRSTSLKENNQSSAFKVPAPKLSGVNGQAQLSAFPVSPPETPNKVTFFTALTPVSVQVSTKNQLPNANGLQLLQPSRPVVPTNGHTITPAQQQQQLQQLQRQQLLLQQQLQKQSSATESSELSAVEKHLHGHSLLGEFAEKYTLVDELGSGGFGFVVTAIRLSDGVEVAVKFVFKDKVPIHCWSKDDVLGVVPTEIYILKNIHHKNIVTFLDFYEDSKFFYLIMELHGVPWATANIMHNPVFNNSSSTTTTTTTVLPSQQLSSVSDLESVTTTTNNNKQTTPFSSINNDVKRSSEMSIGTSDESSSIKSSGIGGLVDCIDTKSRANLLPTSMAPMIKRSMTSLPTKMPPKIGRRQSMDLFECIETHSKISERLAKKIFKQVVDAVEYLLDHNILHRDIKDENVVIDQQYHVKLIDFGSASFVPRNGRLFDRFAGTIQYCPPEILRGEKYRGPEQEIWSLGTLLHIILFAEPPFADPIQTIQGDINSPKVPASNEVMELLRWMLAKKPRHRPTVQQIKQHVWLSGVV